MPRVTTVAKARKSPGECGKCGSKIKKGHGYRWWKFRYGGRRVRCMESACSPKPSDLTQSEFYGNLYGIQEDVDAAIEAFRAGGGASELAGALNDAAERLRELGQECQDKFDNMPDGLQQGDTGQLLEQRVEGCEEKADELDSAASEAESITDESTDDEREEAVTAAEIDLSID